MAIKKINTTKNLNLVTEKTHIGSITVQQKHIYQFMSYFICKSTQSL